MLRFFLNESMKEVEEEMTKAFWLQKMQITVLNHAFQHDRITLENR